MNSRARAMTRSAWSCLCHHLPPCLVYSQFWPLVSFHFFRMNFVNAVVVFSKYGAWLRPQYGCRNIARTRLLLFITILCADFVALQWGQPIFWSWQTRLRDLFLRVLFMKTLRHHTFTLQADEMMMASVARRLSELRRRGDIHHHNITNVKSFTTTSCTL